MIRAVKMLLALTLGVTIISCTGGSVLTSDSKHPVGKSIGGTYTVYFESDTIGYLDLKDNQYSFTGKEGAQIPEAATERLSFVKNPKGYYSIKYYGSVSQDTLLENVGHLEILSYMEFGIEQTGQLGGSLFLIRSDKKGKMLYFHSIGSELEMWRITKPWD